MPIPEEKRYIDVTLMCKMDVPASPVTVYHAEHSFSCPHCDTPLIADVSNMKVDHPKHEVRQIVERDVIAAK